MSGMPRTVEMEIDGLRWSVRVAGSGPALLLLHGFTGSGRTWEGSGSAPSAPGRPGAAPDDAAPTSLADEAVRAGFAAIAPDLPGHGRTAWQVAEPARSAAASVPAPGSVEGIADVLPRLLDALGHDRAGVVGYSMGARVALRLAIAHPAFVTRLVLEAPSAGIADPAERSARRDADEALAASLERDGIAPFVDAWERMPVLAGEARASADARAALRANRLEHDPAGLAASLRTAGQGTMEALRDRLGEVSAPTLVIVGADDPARQRAEAVAEGIPGARLARVPGAGHAPHLEAPAAFIRLVLDFVTEERVA